jgi:hypothetical protein
MSTEQATPGQEGKRPNWIGKRVPQWFLERELTAMLFSDGEILSVEKETQKAIYAVINYANRPRKGLDKSNPWGLNQSKLWVPKSIIS